MSVADEPVDPSLLAVLRTVYRGKWEGIHGIAHWLRVRRIGRLLAEESGADRKVVEAFALVHDVGRWEDGRDPDHGRRSAVIGRRLNDEYLGLDARQLALFEKACAFHTAGDLSADPTIGTCWDADRLDLSRLEIHPDRRFLSTRVARRRQTIDWAWRLGKHRAGDLLPLP